MSDRRASIVWTIVFVAAGLFLAGRALFTATGMGREYVEARQVVAVGTDRAGKTIERRWVDEESATYGDYLRAERADPGQRVVHLSVFRTVGLWFSAFLTLAIFSFLYGDNPIYKLAEAIFIGMSAAYWMVVGFWTVIVPNLIGKIAPGLVQSWAIPGLEGEDLVPRFIYLVPLALGVMLLWRLAPKGAWIARWPLALFIGVFAGLRLVQFLQADLLNQIAAGIKPLVALGGNGGFLWGATLANIVSVVGVLCCLAYFFFSVEHKGAFGGAARVGIWVLMITFGAMFGYTVMGRIVLLVARLEFLFNDWLWLIDPAGNRVA
ncbi:MAG: hypothetical protein U0575_00345 [Phycisphaerales bacterium]